MCTIPRKGRKQNMKTKITETVFNTYRVLWKDGKLKGGYRDFYSNQEAINYIKELKNEK